MLTIELAWNPYAHSEFVGYQLGADVAAASTIIGSIPKTETSVTLQIDLNTRQLYRFWVRAYDAAGNFSPKTYLKNAYQA